jgi:hypothetical protein
MKPLLRNTTCLLVMTTGLVLRVVAQDGPRPQSPPVLATPQPQAAAQPQPPKPEFPPHTDVLKDYTEVVSTIDRARSLLSLWTRTKDNQMLAAFPERFEQRRFFIALTVASGETYAGLQAGEMYVYWRRQDNRMVLMEENVDTRSTGDDQSKAAVSRLFTDRVITDVPILALMPMWGPIIDVDALLVGQAEKFFGPGMMRDAKKHLARIKTAKAFPGNIEIAYEIPMGDGVLKTLHYSISEIVPNAAFRARKADERVGYFTTSFADLGKYQAEESRVRYINRWHLEKADPQLKVSPVKNPIIFYVENTTPIRYRRWVREGVLMWNKAFEKVGFANAIEVYYQDAGTRAHMEKDPEDVRYNFVRWLNNNIGTAIGPSRVNPLTGQILDADIILTDGWIRHYWRQFNETLPELAMEGFSPETLAWLKNYPEWDPRVRLAPPASRDTVLAELMRSGPQAYGGHPLAAARGAMVGGREFDGLVGRSSQINGFCRAAECKALDMAMMRFSMELWNEQILDGAEAPKDDGKGEKKEAKKPEDEMLDGIPEWFVGPLIAELVAHEVGHTLGLRHNFKASSIYPLEKINGSEVKGKKPFAGSVMDYLPVNMFRINKDDPQGDYTMIEVGPYDMWAIEYGYTLSEKPEDMKKILSRVSEPELQYATDEDTFGPDPFARRYDFAANPLAYAKRQMDLAKYHRGRIIEKFVKEGQSWGRARYGYEMTLAVQSRSLSMMANWVGGAFVNRDKKGDPKGRPPLQTVPASDQRDALQFVVEHAFRDGAFGLTPELLQHMTIDKWLDEFSSAMQNSTWPVHDRVMGIQASVLTMLLNPSTLGRAYDNELITSPEKDMITLPEIFDTLHKAIWGEILQPEDREFTARKPMVSSLRRNLQREHLERLINLSMPNSWRNTSHKPVSNLALSQLRKLSVQIGKVIEEQKAKLDAYSEAHLSEAKLRIEKALDMNYIYNVPPPASSVRVIIGSEPPSAQP